MFPVGPSRRFRRVCEHLQALMSSPRGENHRKISTDSTVSYCSELVPASYCSSAKENGDADVCMKIFFFVTKLDVKQNKYNFKKR